MRTEMGRSRSGSGRGSPMIRLLRNVAVVGGVAGTAAVLAGAPALAQDPGAEREYRAARTLLSRGNWPDAAERFAAIAARYPDSEYAPVSLYWQGVALYRLGDEESLERALEILERVAERYPGWEEESRALEVRIRGELARRGDASSAEEVIAVANRSVEVADRQAEAAARTAELLARQAEVAAERAAANAEAIAARAGAIGPRAVRSTAQEACPDENRDVQMAALSALMRMDAEQAMPILRRLLARRDECSVPLRRQALFLVSQKAGPEAEAILLEAVRNDPAPEVRRQAVVWLSQVDSERAVEMLEEIAVSSDDDPELQERAVFALSQHDGERAQSILRSYAEDRSRPTNVREKAIFWLGRRPENAEFLRELYGRLEDSKLRERVFTALALGGDEAAVDWMLERALDDSEPLSLRKKALFWAARAGVEWDRLAGLYDRLTEPEMKEQLLFVYAQAGSQAVDRLIEIVQTEPDPSVRKKAILWLGQSGDPRAAEFLVELLARQP